VYRLATIYPQWQIYPRGRCKRRIFAAGSRLGRQSAGGNRRFRDAEISPNCCCRARTARLSAVTSFCSSKIRATITFSRACKDETRNRKIRVSQRRLHSRGITPRENVLETQVPHPVKCRADSWLYSRCDRKL